jgi:hypothetical protein
MAAGGERIYVAARRRMVSSDIPIASEQGEILVLGRDLQVRDRLVAPFPLRDMHQIAWHQKMLWVTCSYDNCVATWDGSTWQRWYPLNESPESACDLYHYNSFLFEQRRIWLLAHGWGASELLGFCPRTRALLERVRLGNQAHNIWREGESLHTCSSGEGRILGACGFSVETGGFPRGYARKNGTRYVGISELAEREERDLTEGKVRIYDSDWNPLGVISLPGEGLVLDICAL